MIPVCRPCYVGNEVAYARRAVESGWISSAGEFITGFERLFATFAGCREGVACCNGTAAVHLALLAAGVGPGDRVVVPSFTMMASVFPIVQLGAAPVFVDCDPDTWTLDPAALEAVAGPVKAVMVVHIYGHPCDMDPIQAWADRRGAVVIEDAAEAHGATYKGRRVGSLGDVAAFSFYSNKIISCGEGGMVTTDRPEIAERARYFRNLCFDRDPGRRFIHEDLGYNFRMSNVQAAIGLAQTECGETLVAMRREMARRYRERLAPLEEFLTLPPQMPWAENVFWMFGVVLRESTGLKAADVRARLAALGVETRSFFYPGHLQPCLREFVDGVRAPVSEALFERGLYLPSSSDLSADEADQVVAALSSALRGAAHVDA